MKRMNESPIFYFLFSIQSEYIFVREYYQKHSKNETGCIAKLMTKS